VDPKPAAVRLNWLDGIKGISILWIAFFHGFRILIGDGRYPSALGDGYLSIYWAQCAPQTLLGDAGCALAAAGVAISQVGFHAVAVFLVLSGFGLTYSLAKTGEPAGGWLGWYRSRLLRLFPMYWVAHLVYLLLPFQARYEALDYRFVLSFLGDRIYPVEMIFYYFNPALWYFGLLLQLYLVYPLLFRLLQKVGPTAFLVVTALATLAARYVMLVAWPVNGLYLQGAFFLPRLWEFALGMALGLLYRRDAPSADRWLFCWPALVAGAVLYWLGVESYATTASYTFADPLIGTGLAIVLAHLARQVDRIPAIGPGIVTVGAYSYGLYLVHQPFVLYVAAAARHLPTPGFVAVLAALIAVLATVGMAVEIRVNQLTQRVLG
jgi:peptidoglycan/LPS O-acetylase OafA/YrhL